MTETQLSLLGDNGWPEGLAYAPDFIGSDAQAELVNRIAALPFKPFEFQGFLGKRETVSFGWSYRFDGTGLIETDPISDWLLPVRARKEWEHSIAPVAALRYSITLRSFDRARVRKRTED